MEITRMAFAANMLINQVVQVKKGESVVIVTDTDRPPIITQALAYSAISAGGIVVVVKMDPRRSEERNRQRRSLQPWLQRRWSSISQPTA
jgi:leucyl aminopeptidase (aminopeptidase T)